jgi:hypothetical protein
VTFFGNFPVGIPQGGHTKYIYGTRYYIFVFGKRKENYVIGFRH